jgi:hypothetical protein
MKQIYNARRTNMQRNKHCDKLPIAIDLLIDLNNLTQKRFLSNLKKLVPVTVQKAFIHVENSVNIPFHVKSIY